MSLLGPNGSDALQGLGELAAIIHRTGSGGMGVSRFPLKVVSGRAFAPPAEDGGVWEEWFGGLRTKGSCRGHIAPSLM